jgi:4-hydroxy-tetrahydrodipicolinate synthase
VLLIRDTLRFEGIIPAVFSPFNRKLEIDEEGYSETLRFLMSQGVPSLMCAGSTGEGAALAREERKRLVSITVEGADHRVPVIASTGAPRTNETITYTKDAKRCWSRRSARDHSLLCHTEQHRIDRSL